MFRESALLRGLLIAGICLPLALFIGYQLATPEDRSSLFWIGLVFCFLIVPFLIRWHHPMLIICWNLPLVAFFLPGQPRLAIVMAAVSLFVSVVSRTLSKQTPFISCPSVSIPLILLAAVVLITAELTGGIHGSALGGRTMGAGRYLALLGAIMGYFALVAQPLPPKYAKPLAYVFFLSGAVSAIPALISIAGLDFQFLDVLFAGALNNTYGSALVERFTGFEWTAEAFCGFMLMRFGIRGIFDASHPWRWTPFIIVFCLGTLGGFRSFLLIFFILFMLQLYFEKLFRSRLFFGFLLSIFLAAVLILPFAEQLPLSVQRSISFLPVNVSPVARQDAESSLDFRLQVWRVVLAEEVPKYLFLGKGYNFDSMDLYLTQLGMQRGIYSGYEWVYVSSDYHSGPLTLIVAFGIFGVLAFAAFCWGALRALYANYRYGDPTLNLINIFLLANFITSLVFYLIFYGAFFLDLINFTGIIGLSLTLNGGVRRAGQAAIRDDVQSEAETPRLQSV